MNIYDIYEARVREIISRPFKIFYVINRNIYLFFFLYSDGH